MLNTVQFPANVSAVILKRIIVIIKHEAHKLYLHSPNERGRN